MALVLKDRVKETSSSSGLGNITLTGAFAGYQTFNSAIASGSTVYYTIHNLVPGSDTEWEVGVGTFTSPSTLSRDTILSSSTGSKVSFTSGTEGLEVFITQPAEEAVYINQATGKVEAFGNGTNTITFTEINTSNLTANTVTLTAGTISTNAANATDITNKQYVDGLFSTGISYHDPVRVESPTALSPVTYNNGSSGVGATLTNAGTQTALVIDGITLSLNDRVLIYTQTDQTQNGIYTVTNVGSGSTNWVLTRATDADSFGLADPNALGQGDAVFVQQGNTGAGETYVCNTPGTIVFGTTNITFVQISSAQVYSAGTGLNLSNLTFSIANTAVTAATYGNDGNVAQFTVNAQGQITNASNVSINASSITLGTLDNARTTASSSNGANTIVLRDSSGDFAANTVTATTVNATSGNFTNVSGNGSAISAINASNISSGTIANARTTASTSNSANTIVARDANGSFGANIVSASFSGDGSAISAINASNISSGTIANARTTAASANGASTIVQRDSGGNFSANTVTAAVIGDLSGGSAINASNISSGTIANARTTASSSNGASTIVLRDAGGAFAAGAITATSLSGNGASITAINASAITTGTIDNARTTASSANGASTIVARDANGSFAANTVTATNVSITTGLFGNGSNTTPSISFTNSTGTGLFLPAANTIAFTEGGVEAMRITSAGDVGIGTSSPATRLVVGGSTGNYGLQIAPRTDFSTLSGQLLISDSTGSACLYTASGDLTINTGATVGTNGGTERMRIAANGNVGIGTSSPTRRLDVRAAYTTDTIVAQIGNTNNGNGSTPVATIFDFTEANGTSVSRISSIYTQSVGTTSLAFGTYGSGSLAERMRIDSSGNLLVGGTAAVIGGSNNIELIPTKSGGVTDLLVYNSSNTANSTARIWISNGGTAARSADVLFSSGIAGTRWTTGVDSTDSDKFKISSGGYTTPTGTARLTINTSGNVGIGTSSPLQKLSVTDASTSAIEIISTGATAQLMLGSSGTNPAYINYNRTGAGSLAFYDTNAAAERMRITSAGSVQIGTTAEARFTVGGSITGATNSTIARIGTEDYTTNTVLSVAPGVVNFDAPGVVGGRMCINSSGNIGIGTTNPGTRLDILNTTRLRLDVTSSGAGVAFWKDSTPTFASNVGNFVPGGSVTNDLIFSTFASSTWSERMRIDSSGNVGIGVTPSAWSIFKAMQVGTGTLASTTGTHNTSLAANAYFDGTNWKYIVSANASEYRQNAGDHFWVTAASGTAGNNISWSERMRISNTGALGFSGANYGTAGQVLTSNGSGSAPSWQAAAGFPSGTVMLFAQTAAPTGWTKNTTTGDNHALRVVTGTASSGGSVAFTTAFASQTPTITISAISGSAGATTLTTPQIPAHSHNIPNSGGAAGGGKSSSGNEAPEGNINTNNTGGGGSHTHPFSFSSGTATSSAINLAVQYIDVIRATKD